MSVMVQAVPELVHSDEGLEQLVRILGRQPRIAVDTESNSLHAYRERVCLIQFSTADRDYILDPLAFDALHSLAPVFSDPGIEKIFHASEYDVICLRRDYGFSFASIFDTMQAGRILGRKQAGLDRLLEEKFAVKVNKRFQKADWGVRPLSPDLLRYAVLDTHYLIPLRDLLQAELEARDLWPLAQEDFQMACKALGPTAKTESPAWVRLRRRRDLTPQDLSVMHELLAWRDELAAQLDRPPFKVLNEEQLVEIARARPRTLDDLEAAGLGARQANEWGQHLLEAVARGLASPLVEHAQPTPPTRAYLKRFEKLKEWRKNSAAAMDVESDVVLPRGLLLALAEKGLGDMSSIMKPSPWRLAHFGDQIAQVLQAAA